MLQYLSSSFSLLKSPIQTTMSDSYAFSSLLVPNLCTNTSAFLSVYRDGIEQSDNTAALTRFSVQAITLNKKINTLYQHEYMTLSVLDQVTGKNHFFYLERQASPAPSTPTPEISVPSTPTPEISAPSTPTSGDQDSETYPLLIVNPPSRLATLNPHSAKRSSSYGLSALGDKLSIASAKLLSASAATSSTPSAADDRFLGSGTFINSLTINNRMGVLIDQMAPKNLSLFELGILADVVHNEAPTYTLYGEQCYWYTSVILDVLRLFYEDTLKPAPDATSDEAVPIISSDYLPQLAGRWKHLLIIAPEGITTKAVITKAAVNFALRQDVEFSKVISFLNFDFPPL